MDLCRCLACQSRDEEGSCYKGLGFEVHYVGEKTLNP